ncbi:hypothetical protein AJ79_06726 [Helicocarpus griseus UAMH5409]|uniref:Autophagy-related protein 101 n=1 Tax=Helicocarpus griseus UAMH5409 TaxID=1447875 RepID=A0A2B7XA03_9EURO|nr:hypothetical protein AJ79_06726 [Helicocarpus griseus UAMH5409]
MLNEIVQIDNKGGHHENCDQLAHVIRSQPPPASLSIYQPRANQELNIEPPIAQTCSHLLNTLSTFLAIRPRSSSLGILVQESTSSISYPRTAAWNALAFQVLVSTFRDGGAREQAREQIATVTLHVGDGDGTFEFVEDVESRARKLWWNDSLSSSPAQVQSGGLEVNQLVQTILKPAALATVHEREGRAASMNATETYPVFIVYIRRPRPGKTQTNEPTSIS